MALLEWRIFETFFLKWLNNQAFHKVVQIITSFRTFHEKSYSSLITDIDIKFPYCYNYLYSTSILRRSWLSWVTRKLCNNNLISKFPKISYLEKNSVNMAAFKEQKTKLAVILKCSEIITL